MLHCYFFALCAGSALDKTTNNFTLFNLVEQAGVLVEDLGSAAPIEVHAYFLVEEEDKHTQFDMRVIRTAADGTEDPGGPLPFQTEDKSRFRVRVQALRLPRTFGSYVLRLEWRRRGADVWHAESPRWPLVLVEVPPIAAVPSSQLPGAP